MNPAAAKAVLWLCREEEEEEEEEKEGVPLTEQKRSSNKPKDGARAAALQSPGPRNRAHAVPCCAVP